MPSRLCLATFHPLPPHLPTEALFTASLLPLFGPSALDVPARAAEDGSWAFMESDLYYITSIRIRACM